MNRFLAMAALLCVMSTSCIQVEQATTLFPDGSGKVVLTIGISPDMKKQQPGGGPSDFKDPAKMESNSEGIVAWATPVETEKDGWTYVSMTAYFEDINKVRIYKDGDKEPGKERKAMFAFEYKKTAAGGTLKSLASPVDDVAKPADKEAEDGPGADMAKAMADMIKKMLAGFKFTVKLTLPGAVTEAPESMTKDGRAVSIVIDDKLMIDAMDGKKESLKKMESLNVSSLVTWAKNEVSDADIAAFKAEMAKAKDEWKAWKESTKK